MFAPFEFYLVVAPNYFHRESLPYGLILIFRVQFPASLYIGLIRSIGIDRKLYVEKNKVSSCDTWVISAEHSFVEFIVTSILFHWWLVGWLWVYLVFLISKLWAGVTLTLIQWHVCLSWVWSTEQLTWVVNPSDRFAEILIQDLFIPYLVSSISYASFELLLLLVY